MDPLVSVILPTRERPEKLRACLDLLARQEPDSPPFEVLVSLDGPCEASREVIQSHTGLRHLTVTEAPRQGIAVAKNQAIERATGRLLLFINDDVLPSASFVSSHALAHSDRENRGLGDAMVLGHSPWVMPEGATLFDRLMAQSSLVFFYDQMITELDEVSAPRDHDWGFRHAWNLNLSVRASLVREAGGFCPAIANCCYEDIELAWRMNRCRDGGVPVLFRPEASAPHDHRYTPDGYLEREHRLGYAAYGFAKASPECALEVFGCELDAVDELAYAARFIEHEQGAEKRLLASFRDLAGLPADAIARGDTARKLLKSLEQQAILLRRLAFRRGLILAAEGGRIEGLFHPADGLETPPPLRPHAQA